MVGAKYGLIEWYIESGGDNFDLFRGRNRDDIIDETSDSFFNEMIKKAKAAQVSSKKYAALSGLKASDWRDHIKPEIENKTLIWFDEKLKDKINTSRLVKTRKEEMIRNISDYQSEDDVENDIDEYVKIVEQVKSDFKSASTIEEREEAIDKLRSESPKTYNALRGWETRRGPEAVGFVFSQLD